MSILGINTTDLVFVGLLVVGVGIVWSTERKDIRCPTLTASTKECDTEGGMPFSHSRPLKTDGCKTLINKIRKAVGAEQASIKWRRAFVLASLIILTIWILLPHLMGGNLDQRSNETGSWKYVYVGVIITFTILLCNFNYYSYHVFGVAEVWAKESLTLLETNGCIRD